MYRGAFHFLTAAGTGEDQGVSFAKYVKLHGLLAGDLAPVVDFEWDKTKTNPDRWATSGLKPTEMVDKLLACLKAIQRETGRRPVVYTMRQWWIDRKIPEAEMERLAGYPIWIAEYSNSHHALDLERPSVPNNAAWALWQFSASGTLNEGYVRNRNGSRRGVDTNVFKGTQQAFLAAFDVKE
jgi:lysozyme